MQPIPTGLIGYGTAGAFFHAPLIAAASGPAPGGHWQPPFR